MQPSSNRGVGGNICLPDPCATPPTGAPVPYVNVSQNATVLGFSLKIFNFFMNMFSQAAVAPMTMGDNAGVMSPFMGPGMVTMGNPKIFFEAMPAVHLGCPATGNNMIAGVGLVAVPSMTNVMLTHAGLRPGELDAAMLEGLARALVPSRDESAECMLPGAVAFARIPVFSIGLPARIHDLIQRSTALGMSALILDLRGCPGGELTSAVELASDFLPEGEAIATVVDAAGDETVYRSRNERPHAFPVVLVVDRHTASAAEIFAGCLSAHRRAIVVGERTFGKGSAQQVVPGSTDVGAWYTTVATITLPGGEPLDGHGVRPDLVIASPAPPPRAADLVSPEAITARLAADPALSIALAAARATDGAFTT